MNRSDWTPGDANVARLLGQAYDPPSASAAFAARVQAQLQVVAAEAARQREAMPPWSPFNRRLAALAGVAALLGIVALGLSFLPRPTAPSSVHPAMNDGAMVAAPLSPPPRSPRLMPGAALATRDGERRRVTLPDGSVLSVNQNTLLHYDARRHLTLKAGEIFVEVAPRLAEKAASLFTVTTPHRAIRAIGTKFLVRADADGTAIAVTQGQVHVSDWEGLLSAGQQLAPKASAVTPTPRLSYLLDWTRDLVVSAAPTLVPANSYSGGALVAIDSQGHTAPLTLRKYHIDVHIEDGFARTTIDQTYFNHTSRKLEGTFYFPLPADASLSRLAMYVEGRLMEGGMVERDYGRAVFEQIVTKRKDPALLEWVDGHTFKMRVFPLEARQEKRIVLGYTQRLPNLYGRLSYRSPAGHSLGAVRDWSFHARVKNGANLDWRCDSHPLTPRVEKSDLLLDTRAHRVAMERDIVLDLRDRAGVSSARTSTAEQDGYRYLMLRYRPDLPGTTQRQRRDWVFLFESSADRDPLLARTQVEVIRSLLTNAEHEDTFALLTVDTQVRHFAPMPQRVTPVNIAAALAFLDKTHLLGALDLDAGLTAAAERLRDSRNPVLVHLGSGQTVLGERRAEVLASRLPREATYVGVAVGKRGAHAFMQRAADRCQGYVTQINPDEPVAWRSFDLLATLNTPRLLGVRVTDAAGEAQFLSATAMLAQGEEWCAIARLPVAAALPKSLRITATLDGRAFQRELPVESPRSGAAYLPRTWAKLEIDRLLAEDAQKNKDAIVALSKTMYVMTPYTSLLVLENEAMVAQYKVDRGRKDHWAMYPCPPKIPVIYEPSYPCPLKIPVIYDPSPQDWKVKFDPVTGQPLNPLDDENNQLGFYPPSLALIVKGSATIHSRGYSIQLEPPGLERLAQSLQSDTELKERIRQENRERSFGSAGTVRIVHIPVDAYIFNPTETKIRILTDERTEYERDFSPVADSPDPENAERLLASLLADPTQAKRSSLWRQAARVAEQRKQYDLARQRLERALALEAKQPRDLAARRRDYAWFLSLACKRANELSALRRPVPRDLLDGVMAIADRWRAIDPVEWIPCAWAARILRLAGERELAWAYLTTPSALHGATVARWLEVARRQHWQGAYDLAERAFAAASSLEPANVEILRERALNQGARTPRREGNDSPP